MFLERKYKRKLGKQRQALDFLQLHRTQNNNHKFLYFRF
jgi:hypothetical protein